MAPITKSQLYRLLFMVLIDPRAEGHNAENRLVFLLADLFHNVPPQLERVDRGDLAPEDILRWLRTRARGTPMESWLNLRERAIIPDGRDKGISLSAPAMLTVRSLPNRPPCAVISGEQARPVAPGTVHWP